MDVIYRLGRSITLEWKILEGDNMITPDFHRMSLEVFLNGNTEEYNMDYTIRDDGNGVKTLVMEVDTSGLQTGVYDLKAIWYKNRNNIFPKKEYNRYLLWSVRKNVFAITDSMDEVADKNKTSYFVSVKSYVEPKGADGLSAYEIALFRGLTDIKSEGEWIGQELIRQENEEQRKAAEEERKEREAVRETNELARINAETLRATEEGIRQQKETDRQTAEDVRESREEVRTRREELRDAAEALRETNETTRRNQEAERVRNEEDRHYSEQDRYEREVERISNEKTRVDAEAIRASNEEARKASEAERVSNETDRQTAEEDREERISDALSEIRGVYPGYFYMGICTPESTPLDTNLKVFYLAMTGGVYASFGDIEVLDGEVVYLMWDGVSWSKEETGMSYAVKSPTVRSIHVMTEDELTNLTNPIEGAIYATYEE